MNTTAPSVGSILRQWRQRRSLSQLALAADAEISQRHLSFIESGRSTPSRDMVVRLAERLLVPLRERNRLLLAAGFAPVYGERTLGDPHFAAAHRAMKLILKGHEPFPALAVDRHWFMREANDAVGPLLAGADAALLKSPVNVLRLSLDPRGLAPRIVNFRQWRAHVLARLSQQIDISADPVLNELHEELAAFPVPAGARPWRSASTPEHGGIAVPLILSSDKGVLSFISTTTVFGTALDIGLSELAIESFFPADEETARILLSGLRATRAARAL